MVELGRLLIGLGVALVLMGGIVLLAGRTGVPLGRRLPGDILYRGKNTTFYFPLATSILISVVLSLVLYLIGRLKR
jgi:ABC-type glucose/galactose transport system permease subunit